MKLINKDRLVQTKTGEKLFKILVNIWNDEHFIIGVLGSLKTDEQKQKMIDIIENGETDTDQLLLWTLEIKNEEV